jgi:hypothetical protein
MSIFERSLERKKQEAIKKEEQRLEDIKLCEQAMSKVQEDELKRQADLQRRVNRRALLASLYESTVIPK